jgi:hypothetical protein
MLVRETQEGRVGDKEDVSSYWMTLGNGEYTGI